MKYLIASANGYGNTGDDIIAVVIRRLLREADPTADVRLTRPPYDAESMDWADAVVIGGGGLLYDYDEVKSNVKNYMQYAEEATKLGKPFYIIGVGEQGIFSTQAKDIYRKHLNNARLITVRSEEDKKVLIDSVGVTQQVHALQDVAFALDVRPGTTMAAHIRKLFRRKPKLAFGLPRLGGQGLQINRLGARAARSIREYEAYLDEPGVLDRLFQDFDVTFVCQSRDDLEYCKTLQKRYGSPLVYADSIDTIERAIRAYRASDVVLTGRFHGLILAALLGKSTVAVGMSGHKLDKLITEQLSSLTPSFFALDAFVEKKIPDHLADLYREGRIATVNPEEVAACRQLALRTKELLREAISKDLRP